jgi:hypothetical protein
VTAVSPGPGRGTTFIVRLPRIDAPQDAPSPANGAGSLRTGLRVLVVEDHDDARETWRHRRRVAGPRRLRGGAALVSDELERILTARAEVRAGHAAGPSRAS